MRSDLSDARVLLVAVDRKRTIIAGLVGFAAMLVWGYTLTSPALAPLMLALAGVAWSLILVNSLHPHCPIAQSSTIELLRWLTADDGR